MHICPKPERHNDSQYICFAKWSEYFASARCEGGSGSSEDATNVRQIQVMTIIDNFGIKDILDILLVAILMHQGYRLVKRSGSAALFKGVLAFFVIWIIVSQILQMRLLGSILDKFLSVGIIVVIILFQDEIRRFLTTLGTNRTFRWLQKLFRGGVDNDTSDAVTTQIVQACLNMTKSYTGALIVLEQGIILDKFRDTGEKINGDVSSRLIEAIFFKNSALHDGAMIIAGNKIISAGSILPISHSSNMPNYLGLRHRAALGMSKETDAKIIVISEERGSISFVQNGEIELNISPQRLQELISAKH